MPIRKEDFKLLVVIVVLICIFTPIYLFLEKDVEYKTVYVQAGMSEKVELGSEFKGSAHKTLPEKYLRGAMDAHSQWLKLSNESLEVTIPKGYSQVSKAYFVKGWKALVLTIIVIDEEKGR